MFDCLLSMHVLALICVWRVLHALAHAGCHEGIKSNPCACACSYGTALSNSGLLLLEEEA
jgi:hypothetical protein